MCESYFLSENLVASEATIFQIDSRRLVNCSMSLILGDQKMTDWNKSPRCIQEVKHHFLGEDKFHIWIFWVFLNLFGSMIICE